MTIYQRAHICETGILLLISGIENIVCGLLDRQPQEMKQQSEIANLPKFSMIVLLLSLLISAFYFLSQFLPFSLIFCCFLNKTFIMMILTWILRAMFKSPMVMPSMTSNASKILFHYICGLSLVMIGQKLRPVSREMWQFHLNMNIEGTLWRHSVTSSVTSWTSKTLFMQ